MFEKLTFLSDKLRLNGDFRFIICKEKVELTFIKKKMDNKCH